MAIRFTRLMIAGAAAFGASMVGPGAALAADEAGATQAQPTSSIRVPRTRTASDSNRQVCTSDRYTGTRVPRRSCRSQADRDADRAAQQDAVRDFQHFGASDSQFDNSNAGDKGSPSPN